MLRKYRKIATIKAEQFDSDDIDGAYAMCRKYHIISSQKEPFLLKTKEGLMALHDGDWIATGIDGEHWAIANDIFRRTYQEEESDGESDDKSPKSNLHC
ncbi:hypothetical protein AXJ17_gp45 [Lactobacillus phage LfeSau]|uniref:hypothetical protein n=1 Tax=Lactobacillus phage LfeSau TaxID=1567453 RepID=UPI00054127AA|nr:hypothetical protein AXJ17_gp45 [Lactobacillus phage LfeSau]AIY32294.1 hypothetical protein LfeSau_45 [Lactobacillus phage LfeSau]